MISIRPAIAVIATAAVALSLAACAPTARDEQAASDTGGAFPVTVEHALGTATIDAEPERIVTIGWGVADTVVALGTTPVGIERATWGADDDGYDEWTRAAIEDTGDDLPAVFDVYPEIDMEAIVELDPDLVLAPQSGLTQDQYDVLAQLAPTVAYPGDPWQTNWRDEIDLIGQAMGKTDEAAQLSTDIDARLADVASAHPEWADMTFAYVYTAQPGSLSLYKAGDPRVDLLTAMGLVEDQTVADIPIDGDTFTATVGLERADLLNDADLMFTWFNDEENQRQIESQPLYAQIPAIQRGSDVVAGDNALAMATTIITPYSVPYAIERYVPLIEAAAANAG